MSDTFNSVPSLLFTSESVTEGHPDKMCDQISDAVLDACLAQDPRSRVACETATKTGYVMLLGEITTLADINYDKLARDVISEAGYKENFGHSLGHGVGLAIHEFPRYSYAYPHPVSTRAVMTVEPGIYIPGWGGVRLEDLGVVLDDGIDILSRSPKEAVLQV